MKHLLNAFRFLTIIPVPGKADMDARSLPRTLPYYPVVGFVLGLLMAGIAVVASALLPSTAASVIVVIALAAVSGGFHLDGLADTADGVFSARPQDQALDIMKDSSVGVMGSAAVVLVLLTKFAALADMPDDLRWRAAFLLPVAGRCSLVYMVTMLPSARSSSSGLGGVFYTAESTLVVAAAMAGLAVLAVTVAGVGGVLVLALVLAVCFCFSRYTQWKLGGGTGDTAGALSEIVEAVTALALAGLFT